MTLYEAVVLGIVQGLTEFLPISSTAHVYLATHVLGMPDAGAAFTAVIQLGTLAAVVFYFRRELWAMTRVSAAALVQPEKRTDLQARLTLYVVLGTIPIGLAGVLLKKHVEGSFRSVNVIAISLIVVGLVMAAAERWASHKRDIADLRLRDALWIGSAQALAIVPGVSRSGSTLSAALLLGMRRDEAARFSFLLSIPAVAAAGVYELRKAVTDLGQAGIGPLVVGTVVAGLVGYAAIAWLIRFLGRRSTMPFVIYRVAVGVFLLAWVNLR